MLKEIAGLVNALQTLRRLAVLILSFPSTRKKITIALTDKQKIEIYEATKEINNFLEFFDELEKE